MIYVTGDTHRSDLLYLHNFCDNHPELNKNDYIIIAGDFGGVWAKGTLERDLKSFSDLPATILFVDGNHENFDLINSYPVEKWNGGKVHKIKPDIIHLMRGQVFELENQTIFTFGGATSIDRDWRVEGESWWVQELPTFEELDEGIANLDDLKPFMRTDEYLGVHAGVPLEPDGRIKPIENASTEQLVYDRNFKNVNTFVNDKRTVLYGHTPTSYINGTGEIIRYQRESGIGYSRVHIDTGVYLTGILGCYCFDMGKCFYVNK